MIYPLDATIELVKDAVSLEKDDDVLVVNYDFGDNWEFKIKLEKIFDEKMLSKIKFPVLLQEEDLESLMTAAEHMSQKQ